MACVALATRAAACSYSLAPWVAPEASTKTLNPRSPSPAMVAPFVRLPVKHSSPGLQGADGLPRRGQGILASDRLVLHPDGPHDLGDAGPALALTALGVLRLLQVLAGVAHRVLGLEVDARVRRAPVPGGRAALLTYRLLVEGVAEFQGDVQRGAEVLRKVLGDEAPGEVVPPGYGPPVGAPPAQVESGGQVVVDGGGDSQQEALIKRRRQTRPNETWGRSSPAAWRSGPPGPPGTSPSDGPTRWRAASRAASRRRRGSARCASCRGT